jgi:hypothetical protein
VMWSAAHAGAHALSHLPSARWVRTPAHRGRTLALVCCGRWRVRARVHQSRPSSRSSGVARPATTRARLVGQVGASRTYGSGPSARASAARTPLAAAERCTFVAGGHTRTRCAYGVPLPPFVGNAREPSTGGSAGEDALDAGKQAFVAAISRSLIQIIMPSCRSGYSKAPSLLCTGTQYTV